MRTFGPDAARYWLAGQGVRVAKPFNLRWLLPALCGADIKLWWGVWGLSWPLLASGAFWWALGTGATWQVAAAAAAGAGWLSSSFWMIVSPVPRLA